MNAMLVKERAMAIAISNPPPLKHFIGVTKIAEVAIWKHQPLFRQKLPFLDIHKGRAESRHFSSLVVLVFVASCSSVHIASHQHPHAASKDPRKVAKWMHSMQEKKSQSKLPSMYLHDSEMPSPSLGSDVHASAMNKSLHVQDV